MSMGACSPSAPMASPQHCPSTRSSITATCGLVGCTGDSQWQVVSSEISSVHLPQLVDLPTESPLVCPCWSRGMTGRLPCHLMPSKKGYGHHDLLDLWLSSSSLGGRSGHPLVVVARSCWKQWQPRFCVWQSLSALRLCCSAACELRTALRSRHDAGAGRSLQAVKQHSRSAIRCSLLE
eukprot:COSAG06_NODE_16520_length_996_cov_9.536232_1_plen_179_part_00